jgi:signal peptidase II
MFSFVDQLIKFYIARNQSISIPIVGNLLSIKVAHNTYGSFIWSLANNQMPIIIYFFLMPVVFILIRYCDFYQKDCPAFVSAGATLIVSALICSFVDRVFYNGSYDYLLLYSVLYIDLKDCYFIISFFLFLLSILYSKTWEESRRESLILYLKHETKNIRGILKMLKKH